VIGSEQETARSIVNDDPGTLLNTLLPAADINPRRRKKFLSTFNTFQRRSLALAQKHLSLAPPHRMN
jgi:hypothetical protein